MPRWISTQMVSQGLSGITDPVRPLTGNMDEENATRHADVLLKNVRQAANALAGEVRELKEFLATQQRHKQLMKDHRMVITELACMLDQELQG